MNKSIILGGGCFWCTEAIFKRVKGVHKVTSGYSGGSETPTYELVSTGTSGHAEVIKVEYDGSIISLEEILEIFLKTHDPTTPNRQGNDVGPQYRSVIFVNNAEEIDIAKKVISKIESEEYYDNPIVTEVALLDKFYEAENFHRDFYTNNPNYGYCKVIVDPKIKRFLTIFKDKAK